MGHLVLIFWGPGPAGGKWIDDDRQVSVLAGRERGPNPTSVWPHRLPGPRPAASHRLHICLCGDTRLRRGLRSLRSGSVHGCGFDGLDAGGGIIGARVGRDRPWVVAVDPLWLLRWRLPDARQFLPQARHERFER